MNRAKNFNANIVHVSDNALKSSAFHVDCCFATSMRKA